MDIQPNAQFELSLSKGDGLLMKSLLIQNRGGIPFDFDVSVFNDHTVIVLGCPMPDNVLCCLADLVSASIEVAKNAEDDHGYLDEPDSDVADWVVEGRRALRSAMDMLGWQYSSPDSTVQREVITIDDPFGPNASDEDVLAALKAALKRRGWPSDNPVKMGCDIEECPCGLSIEGWKLEPVVEIKLSEDRSVYATRCPACGNVFWCDINEQGK